MLSIIETAFKWLIYILRRAIEEEWFPYFAFIWLFIGTLYDLSQRKSLLRATQELIQQPLIDTKCTPHSNEEASMEGGFQLLSSRQHWIPLYPRELLEQLSCRLLEAFSYPFRKEVLPTARQIAKAIYNFADVRRTIVSMIFAVVLLIFAYGDTIAIGNGLAALGLVQGELPLFLLHYEHAVAAASFFAIIVGFFVLFETFTYRAGYKEEKEHATLMDIRTSEMARLLRGLALIVILIGISVSIFLGLGRLQEGLGFWEDNNTLRVLIQFGVNVLTLVNGILAAALVFIEGITGLQAFIAIGIWILMGILWVLDVFLALAIRLFVFSFDMIWRIVLMILLLVFFIFFKPPEPLLKGFWRGILKPILRLFLSATNTDDIQNKLNIEDNREKSEVNSEQ